MRETLNAMKFDPQSLKQIPYGNLKHNCIEHPIKLEMEWKIHRIPERVQLSLGICVGIFPGFSTLP